MDLGEVERELCRIPEVRAARIVADGEGQPIEVHILASTGKGAKQLVRDVQSVAIASGGIDFDHRIVSVVQLDDDGPPTDADPPHPKGSNGAAQAAPTPLNRVVVDSAVVAKQDLRAVATVTLRRGDERVIGTSDATAASTARWRIVAEATLEALRRLEPSASSIAVEMAGVQRVGDRELAIVTLILVTPPNEELLAGVAPVRGGAGEDAIARAVLSATNRRILRAR